MFCCEQAEIIQFELQIYIFLLFAQNKIAIFYNKMQKVAIFCTTVVVIMR